MPAPLLRHEMFLFSSWLIAVNRIEGAGRICGSHQGGGSNSSLVPPTAVRASHVIEPQPHHTRHISSQTCTRIRDALGVTAVGLALYHIMAFFPLCLVECSVFLIFLEITVVLKYLLIMTKASKCWAVSHPSYLPKFLNILC